MFKVSNVSLVLNIVSSIERFSSNDVILKFDNKFGLMDIDENIVISPEYDNLQSFDDEIWDNYLISTKEDKYGIKFQEDLRGLKIV